MLILKKYNLLSLIFLLIPIISFLLITTQITTYATELGDDFSSNSEIELNELAEGGDYRNKSIKISTLNEETTLTVITDSNKVESEMPYKECEALWNYVMGKDAEYLEDAIGGSFPDSSSFTLKIRVGENTHTVRVEGVDSLLDSRYKDIVKEIIRVSELHAPKDTE